MVIQKMNIIKYLKFLFLWVGTNILIRIIFVVLIAFSTFGGWSLILPETVLWLIFVLPYIILAIFECLIIKKRAQIITFHWILATHIGLSVILIPKQLYELNIGLYILASFYDQLGKGLYLTSLKCFSNTGKIIWIIGTTLSILIETYFHLESLLLITCHCVVNGVLWLILLETTPN
jgi:hypothetical protein